MSEPSRRGGRAALLSLLLPGLAQILGGRRQRGVIILLSTLGIAWLALYEDRPALLAGPALLWLWAVWDAHAERSGRTSATALALLVGALTVYAIAWQVTQINLLRLVRDFPQARPVLLAHLRPNLLTRQVERNVGVRAILVPCPVEPRPPGAALGVGPGSIEVAPDCGIVVDPLLIEGSGFWPEQSVAIWWKNPIGQRHHLREGGRFVTVEADQEGRFRLEVRIPDAVPQSFLTEESQRHEVQAIQERPVGLPRLTETSRMVAFRMLQTVGMALIATTFSIVLAVPVSFLAARNLVGASAAGLVWYYAMRGLLNVLRAIEPLIMAIVFVVWVGLGPFAGTMALMVHGIAALGKLYSEQVESIDPGPLEAITATGADRLQVILYGVVPQIVPPFLAFSVYRWDINVRMSTVIGFVGGGGIGFLLAQWIRLTAYREAAVAIWSIAIVVSVLDYASAELRERIV